MKLDKAIEIAQAQARELIPYCDQILIAGSIRRQRPQVSDIDIVVKPTMIPGPVDLLGQARLVSKLDDYIAECSHRIIKAGEKLVQMNRITRYGDVHVELWIVTPPAQWGVIAAIRTGPPDFAKWFVTTKRQGGGLPSYLRVEHGTLKNRDTGAVVPAETEKDFFAAISLPYVAPRLRAANWKA